MWPIVTYVHIINPISDEILDRPMDRSNEKYPSQFHGGGIQNKFFLPLTNLPWLASDSANS